MGRAAVTGASGFVGGALAAELHRNGTELCCLVRAQSARSHLEALGARLVQGGLANAAAIDDAIRDVQTVYHLAAVVRARNPDEFRLNNIEGTRAVLEACARRPGGPPGVVLVSSLAAAGPSPDGRPLTEADPPRPVSAYGRSKLAQEELAREYAGRVPVVVIRPPVVYGPRDKAVLVLFRLAMAGFSPLLVGGTRRTSLVHVEDLARALRLAGERGRSGTYFVTDGQAHESSALVRGIARALGRRTLTLPVPVRAAGWLARLNQALTPRGRTPVVNPEKIVDISQPYWVCSDGRARQELGYRSEWDLERGLEQTARWYREQRWI